MVAVDEFYDHVLIHAAMPGFWNAQVHSCQCRRPLMLCSYQRHSGSQSSLIPPLLACRLPLLCGRVTQSFADQAAVHGHPRDKYESRDRGGPHQTRFGPSALTIRASNDAGLLKRNQRVRNCPIVGSWPRRARREMGEGAGNGLPPRHREVRPPVG